MIDEKIDYKLEAKKAAKILWSLSPEARLYLAEFMSFSDEGMTCPDVGEAMESADIHSLDGKPIKRLLNIGIPLRPVFVGVNFSMEDGYSEIHSYKILEDK